MSLTWLDTLGAVVSSSLPGGAGRGRARKGRLPVKIS